MRLHKLLYLFPLLLVIALLIFPVEAKRNSLVSTAYYVSPLGSDTNPCSSSLPCKTISKGISVAVVGDVVNVAAGTYSTENVSVSKSIQLIGNNSTIDATNLSIPSGEGTITITASNAVVQGFEVKGSKKYGIAVYGNGNQILSNKIHEVSGPAIWMRDGNHNLFEGNEIYNSVLSNSSSFNGSTYVCSATKTAWPSAINSWGTASYNTWRNNYVHDNCGEGIVAYDHDLIENNTFKHNWSVESYIDGHSYVTIQNNTFINTKAYIPRGSDQSWRAIPAGVSIADELGCLAGNNTISGNSFNGVRYGVSFYQYTSCSGVKNTVIENNTITNAWDYGFRILNGSHAGSYIRGNIIQLTNGKPLTIQNGAGFVEIKNNTFYSNVNSFEWNGGTYTFTTWNALVGGTNIWSNLSLATLTPSAVPTLTPTRTPTPTPTATSTKTLTPTPTLLACPTLAVP